MRRILLMLLAFVLLVGCHEVFEPDIEDVEPFLVVEGRITTEPGANYVFIFNSKSYTEYPYFLGQTGAMVSILDQNGNARNFDESGNGAYRLMTNEDDVPKVGQTYTLRIVTPDGLEYRSTPQLIQPSPEISGLFCEYDHNTILTEDGYGQPLEVEFGGINVIHETDGILPSDNYFIYDFVGYEQHHTSIRIGINAYNLYRHRRLTGKYSGGLHTVNADEFGNYRVRNEKLVFITKDDLVNYEPIVDDTIEILATIFEGLLFKLQQFSLSPDAYHFYSAVNEQLAAEGRMFDPASPQVVGNITCVSDSSKQVLGVFAASDVVNKYAYLYFDYKGRTYSRGIDSFPELWLDTCSWTLPETWIRPPF